MTIITEKCQLLRLLLRIVSSLLRLKTGFLESE
nr:MAG TPA: hypothetical protein [Caudoviricetes sp.]